MKRLALCWLAISLLLGGCRREVSGSYLASDASAVCWLQIVRTGDGHLSGQIVSSVLKSDGEVERNSVSLTGAVDGENITLTGGGFLGMGSPTLSGKLSGDSVTLMGMQSAPLSLKRASFDDYQSKLMAQATRSQAIQSARAAADTRQRELEAQKDFVVQVDRLIDRMQTFDEEAEVHLGRFPKAEKGYESITVRINEDCTLERQLVNIRNRSVDRSQLFVEATQVSFETEQMHSEEQSLESSLQTNIVPLKDEAADLEKRCNQSSAAAPVGSEAPRIACNRLLAAAPTFQQKYAAVIAGLSHLEEVYMREKTSQTRLIAEAKQMR